MEKTGKMLMSLFFIDNDWRAWYDFTVKKQ